MIKTGETGGGQHLYQECQRDPSGSEEAQSGDPPQGSGGRTEWAKRRQLRKEDNQVSQLLLLSLCPSQPPRIVKSWSFLPQIFPPLVHICDSPGPVPKCTSCLNSEAEVRDSLFWETAFNQFWMLCLDT